MRVTNRMWDTLPDRERYIIAADANHETDLFKWFNATVLAEAKSKFESVTYWMNQPDTFKYAQHED